MYSYKYYVDSWIEISSQPSSSSLSSGGANDDIVTTGLNVRSDAQHYRRRRRRLQHLATAAAANINYSHTGVPSGEGSSQDEYEESESESDRVLSSSNEDIASRPREDVSLNRENSLGSASETAFSSDEDDTSTALGFNHNPPAFTPQPNVFSHPATSSQAQAYSRARDSSNRSYIPASHSRSTATRTTTRRSSQASVHPSRQHRQQQQHSPYSMISPSHQADHDAALRASLSTLLSCAAAARGLPKNDSQPSNGRTNGENRVEPASLRLVPGSVAMDEDSGSEQKGPRARPPVATTENASPNRGPSSAVPRHIAHQNKHTLSERSTNPPSPTNPAQKAKRKASSSKDRSSANRAASPSSKRSRRAALADSMSSVSPTLMTWVLSAGVVVLFSAVSFSTGYALGRQVGRTEAGNGMGLSSFGADGGNGSGGSLTGTDCGSEAVKGGLRRLRWGSVTGSRVSV